MITTTASVKGDNRRKWEEGEECKREKGKREEWERKGGMGEEGSKEEEETIK